MWLVTDRRFLMVTTLFPGRSVWNRGRMLAKYGAFQQTSRENSHLPAGSDDNRCHKFSVELRSLIDGAQGRTRTGTIFRSGDFKS